MKQNNYIKNIGCFSAVLLLFVQGMYALGTINNSVETNLYSISSFKWDTKTHTAFTEEICFTETRLTETQGVYNSIAESDLSLEIYQIKVRKGSATLVVVKDKTTTPSTVLSSTLIDAGDKPVDGQLIAKIIKDNASSKLNNILITHFDSDHYGGLNGENGLYDLRCKVGNTHENAIVPSNPTDPMNQLKLYTPANGIGKIEKNRTYTLNNTAIRYDWNENTDIPLGGTIKLITLASNAKLRDGTMRMDVKPNDKNSRSGVALIVWGDFTYLVQGDLTGGGNKHLMARTNEANRPTISNTEKRLPKDWNTGTQQFAQDLGIDDITGEYVNERLGIVRKNVNDFYKQNSDLSQNPVPPPLDITVINRQTGQAKKNNLTMYEHKYFIAYPEEWHHKLGEVLNTYNGAGEYAHVCVALIPHHGGMNGNFWFDSKYAIVPSNYNTQFGHPVPQAIEAVYHTAGVTNFYFNYLNDSGPSRGRKLKRLTEINKWINQGPNSNADLENVTTHVLADNETYFKIEVKQDVDEKKQFKINNGDSITHTFTACPSH